MTSGSDSSSRPADRAPGGSASPVPGPVRVAFVIGQLGGGGAEQQLALLVENLDRAEFEPRVYVFTPGGLWASYLAERGFAVEVVPRRGHREPGRALRLYGRFRAWKPHVVFSEMSDAHLYATPAGAAAGVHGIAVHYLTVGARWDRARRWTERRLARYVDVRVGNARAVSQGMTELLGDDPRRQWTIYNAVDMAPFAHPDRADARRRLEEAGVAGAQRPQGGRPGSADAPPLLLAGFIASFSPEKRHDVAVRALARVGEACPRLRLVMAGEGPTLEGTRRLAAELGVLERCVFLGFRGDIAALLPGFDVTLNCSTREGCSNAILESLVAGVPVLASAVGGNPELVEPGVRGLLHASGDEAALAAQLASVCGGEADLAAWGRAGREFVRANFTLERFRAEMTGLLRGLAALPRRRPLAPRGRLLVQPAAPGPGTA